VPLFDFDDSLVVATTEIGKRPRRSVLARSAAMEAMVENQVRHLVEDWHAKRHAYDGLIYMMFWRRDGKIIPLYIGKTETFGKGDNNLSANIAGIPGSKANYARWGDNYAYHVGDLSAVVLLGHPEEKVSAKYRAWADALFVATGVPQPKLREPVHFWTKAWSRSDVGIWSEFGPTRLTFLEYLLIGVASAAFPKILLNREGQNR
jgi:hypothetical protein